MASPFVELFQLERRGALGGALVQNQTIAEKAPQGSEVTEFLSLNRARLCAKAKRTTREMSFAAEPLFEHAANPRSFVSGMSEEPDLVVSLTTISERLESCLDVVSGLAAEQDRFHSINLYISTDPFLLDKGVQPQNALLRRIHEAGANVYLTRNTGPYRKMIPLIFQLRAARAPEETQILTVDDDVVYPDDAWDQMLEIGRPGDLVVAHRGRRIQADGDRIAAYRTFTNPDGERDYRDLPNGRNGVLYRLKFFPPDLDYFTGPVIAPTADDLWAKCVTLIRGVPVVVLEPTAMDDPRKDYAEMFPELAAGLFNAYNATDGNDLAFSSLEAYFSDLVQSPIATLLKGSGHGAQDE